MIVSVTGDKAIDICMNTLVVQDNIMPLPCSTIINIKKALVQCKRYVITRILCSVIGIETVGIENPFAEIIVYAYHLYHSAGKHDRGPLFFT